MKSQTLNANARSAVQHAIANAVKETGSADWDAIMDAVKATGVVITNWMSVRSILQVMINNNWIERTRDLQNEVYVWKN